MNPINKLFILALVAYTYAAPGIEHRADDAGTAVLNEESSANNALAENQKLRDCIQQQVSTGQSQLTNQNDASSSSSSSSSYQNYNMEELRKQFQKCGGDQAAFNNFANSFGSFPNFPVTGSSSASSSNNA